MTSIVTGMTPDQISALSTAVVSKFKTTDIAALTTTQTGALSASQLNVLSAADIKAFKAAQISALTSDALLGLNVSQTANFTATQIGALTQSQVQALTTTQINGLGKADLGALKTAYLTTGQIQGLSTAAIASFSKTQVAALSTDQTKVLSTAQIAAMTSAEISGFSAADITAMSTAQADAIATSAIGGLTTAAVGALTNDDISGLSAAQVNGMTAGQIGALSQAQVGSLSATQINGLSATKIGALSTSQIGALSASALGGLTTKTLTSLTAKQVASLLATRATALSTAQIASFSAAQLASTSLVGVAGGLQFNLRWDSHTTGAPAGFRNAVVIAAASMSANFSNQAVVNLQVGYGEINGQALGAGAAAESSSYGNYFGYSAVNGALQNDAGNSTIQSTADASLGASDPTNGGKFFVSSAEQKALGLKSATSTSLDGYISLSKAIPFEFNQTAAPGKYDAVGAMEHEISEVMGRTGSVGAAYGSGIYTPLDLFRYTSTNNADPASGTPVRSLTQNATSYFSIDGGATNYGNYNASTGSNDYSDWNESELGDPFGYSVIGAKEAMTGNDAIEMAAIGWNLTSSGTTLASAVTAYQLV